MLVDRTASLSFSSVKKSRINFMDVEADDEEEDEELMSSAMKRFCVSSESPGAINVAAAAAAAVHLHQNSTQPFVNSGLPIAFLNSSSGNSNCGPTMGSIGSAAALGNCGTANSSTFGEFISESRSLFSPHSFACQLGPGNGQPGTGGNANGGGALTAINGSANPNAFSIDDLQSQIFSNPIQNNPAAAAVVAAYGNPVGVATPIAAAISGVDIRTGSCCAHEECRHELRCLHRHSSSAPDLRYLTKFVCLCLSRLLSMLVSSAQTLKLSQTDLSVLFIHFDAVFTTESNVVAKQCSYRSSLIVSAFVAATATTTATVATATTSLATITRHVSIGTTIPVHLVGQHKVSES